MRTLMVCFTLGCAVAGCVPDDGSEDPQNSDAVTNNQNSVSNSSGNNAVNGDVGGSCGLSISLTGAVEKNLSWDDRQGCGGGGSEDTQVTVGFGGITTELNVRITLKDVTRGETAVGVPAEVTVRNVETDDSWIATECTVDLEVNELADSNEVGESYHLAGSGRCTGPAVSADGSFAEVFVEGEFSFDSRALW